MNCDFLNSFSGETVGKFLMEVLQMRRRSIATPERGTEDIPDAEQTKDSQNADIKEAKQKKIEAQEMDCGDISDEVSEQVVYWMKNVLYQQI